MQVQAESVMDKEFMQAHSRMCYNLQAEGLNPMESNEYQKWQIAWELGQDLKTVSAKERTSIIEEEFESCNAELARLSFVAGADYKVSEAWRVFNRAVETSMLH